jgi:hypothetical protein
MKEFTLPLSPTIDHRGEINAPHMDTRNFISARNLRREMMHELQQQQRRDSDCSEKLRHVICQHTRAILNIISGLLMSYEKGNITDQDRQLFEKISPSSENLEAWLQKREAEADAAKALSGVRDLLSTAESEYGRLAPLGKTVTGWFSDEGEKAKINVAKQNRDSLRRECQQAESKYQLKVRTIRVNGERFLRDAMSSMSIAILLESPRINSTLRVALDVLHRDVTEIWRNHTKAQTESLDKVLSATADLVKMYQSEQVHPPTPLLGAENAATRN